MTWQPIETAPKDQTTTILVYVPDDDEGEVVWPAHWQPALRLRPEGWRHVSGARWTAIDPDQRWMPLPAPPPASD